jgi:hypothetical protein
MRIICHYSGTQMIPSLDSCCWQERFSIDELRSCIDCICYGRTRGVKLMSWTISWPLVNEDAWNCTCWDNGTLHDLDTGVWGVGLHLVALHCLVFVFGTGFLFGSVLARATKSHRLVENDVSARSAWTTCEMKSFELLDGIVCLWCFIGWLISATCIAKKIDGGIKIHVSSYRPAQP